MKYVNQTKIVLQVQGIPEKIKKSYQVTLQSQEITRKQKKKEN